MSDTFLIPAARVEHELVVNKSRFIAWVAPASDREQAMALLQEARLEYPDARHHCWAYVLGNPGNAASAAANDDGEPSGTAGKPILNVIKHKGIGNIMVVVIRYFGGIKLGAGGLVRAYSAVTQQAVDELELIEQRPLVSVDITLDYSHEPQLRRWMEDRAGALDSTQYGAGIVMTYRLEAAHLDELSDLLAAWQGASVSITQ